MINNLPALRINDIGVALACCGANMWEATKGSGTVLINNKGAHRMGDTTTHCQFASGTLVEGSPDVIIGD
jgi:uncharacterized Zn-binding protein involved in type VI secretion